MVVSFAVRVVAVVVAFFTLAMPFAAAVRAQDGRDVVINELLAVNDRGLRDEDGDPSDWLELANTGLAAVDLSGWHLTDDPAILIKWRFGASPELVLEPGEHLVVFASGKNRDVGPEFHTNFQLSGAGEYLALVEPDGVTVAHEYFPRFPVQRRDISYGLSTEVAPLVGQGDDAVYLVPARAADGGNWTARAFTPDASWKSARIGLGYDTSGQAPVFGEPVSLWSFDGSVADSVGPNDGTFRGGNAVHVEGADGKSGGALRFDGVDDYVEVPQRSGLPIYNRPAYTVAMWVRGGPQNDKRVFSEGSSSNNTPLFTIGTERTGAGGQVDIFIRTPSGGPGHMISDGIAFDGTWHHIAWVDDGGNAALYIDGIRDVVDFSYAKQNMSLDITSIGCVLRSSPCCFFEGEIDGVAVWDEALGPEAIEALVTDSGPGGSLYASWVETDVESDMDGVNALVYLRVPFEVGDPAAFESLALRMRYEDGFVAFLNGVEVARRNAPAALAWNSRAPANRPDADGADVETIDLSSHVGALERGTNVLAIHGLNADAGDGTFLLAPELVATGPLELSARFFRPPTPGAPNGGGFVDFVADTRFTVDRGFFDAPFDVEITTETPGAEIRYTTDGSAPARTRGELYTGPIRIDTTTMLRAQAFRDGHEPTNIDTHTYIFLDDVLRQTRPPGYPTSWAGLRADYDVDPMIATDTRSPDFQPRLKNDLMAIPTMSIVLDPDDLMGSRGIYTNPLNRGRAWERAGSIEYFTADGSRPDFQENCGIRIQGGSSARPIEGKHSFRLVFTARHGPTKLRYPLFEDSPVDEFDTIVLRCCSTDSWHFKDGGARYRRWDSQYIRDVYMRDSQRAMGQLSSHGTHVHLYVNGMYWGLYNPSERPDDSFNAQHQGGEKEDWDIVKDFTESFRGDLRAWNQMMSLASAGLSSEAAYQRIQGNDPDGTPNPSYPVLLDVDNLIDYMILHLWGCAEDWPHHNWYAARDRTGRSGGWRFFVWDQEITMDFVFRNRVTVSNSGSPAFVYSRLRANPEFRTRFGDRVHGHLFNDGVLTVENARERWMKRATELDRAIVGESARWGDFRADVPDPSNSRAELYTRERHWVVERDKVIDEYIPRSRELAIQRFQSVGLYPRIEAPSFSQHGGDIARGFRLEMAAPQGTIYYTVDGTDPRMTGGDVAPDARVYGTAGVRTLLPSAAPARALVPADGALGLAWTAPGFDDASWRPGTTGVGLERTSGYEDLIGLDVIDVMDGVNASVYIRVPFTAADFATADRMILRMKYDDGFIAYLNGVEIARRNAPDDATWNSSATSSNTDSRAVIFEDINVSDSLGLLRAGTNLLAIHGLNSSANSSDMLILPEVTISETTGSGVVLDETTLVSARARTDAGWSALNTAVFAVDGGLRITEIMYHPAPDDQDLFEQDEYEFIELQNTGSDLLVLDGVRFTRGIEFDFTGSAVTVLRPGELVVLAENVAAFELRYGAGAARVAGQYRGKLANDGEELELVGPLGEVIQRFAYSDAWHVETDGQGPSLVIVDPAGERDTWGDGASWRPSAMELGSPGIDESRAGESRQLPGDANADGDLNLSDAVRLLLVLFVDSSLGLPCAGGLDGAGNRTLLDANGDGVANLSDAVHVLAYLFNGGPEHVLGTGCVAIEGCDDSCR